MSANKITSSINYSRAIQGYYASTKQNWRVEGRLRPQHLIRILRFDRTKCEHEKNREQSFISWIKAVGMALWYIIKLKTKGSNNIHNAIICTKKVIHGSIFLKCSSPPSPSLNFTELIFNLYITSLHLFYICQNIFRIIHKDIKIATCWGSVWVRT